MFQQKSVESVQKQNKGGQAAWIMHRHSNVLVIICTMVQVVRLNQDGISTGIGGVPPSQQTVSSCGLVAGRVRPSDMPFRACSGTHVVQHRQPYRSVDTCAHV